MIPLKDISPGKFYYFSDVFYKIQYYQSDQFRKMETQELFFCLKNEPHNGSLRTITFISRNKCGYFFMMGNQEFVEVK